MSMISELWSYLRERKKFWLVPIIVTMLLFGILLVLAQNSAVSVFIYTLF